MPRAYKSFPRVFVEPTLEAGAQLQLGKDAANHLVNVLRLGEGDSVVAFNGRDGAWLSKLAAAGKKADLIVVEGANHFEMMEQFHNPHGLLGRAALRQMGLYPG